MIEFRKSSRALVLTKENKILFIKRIKIGQEPYYVTPGGGIEENENSLEALKRELLEETGSQVAEISFLFHLDDVDMRNSVDFYIAKEVSRGTPSGSEWVLSNEQNKQSTKTYESQIMQYSEENIVII